jgi:hypothetical protein
MKKMDTALRIIIAVLVLTFTALSFASISAAGSVSGNVFYSGSRTGTIYVALSSSPVITPGVPSPQHYAVLGSPGAYIISVPDGTYYVGAIRTNSLTAIQAEDPYGMYGINFVSDFTADSVTVSGGAAVTGKDFIMIDGTAQNPNPFYVPVAAGSIQLSSATYSVSEAGPTVTITAVRTGGSAGMVGISYATANGTATAGSDYASASGALSWTDGDTANKTFTVPIINDAIAETSETFTVTLSSPAGSASLGSPATATVTIMDDDGPSTVPQYAVKVKVKLKGSTATGLITSDLPGISCPLDCTESYRKDEVVTLTATPSADLMFSGWSGSCLGTQKTCTLTMTTKKSVSATFVPYPALTVIKSGTGAGAITSNDNNINCGNVDVPDCSEVYTTPETVILTATPALHSSFTVWKGCTAISGNTCTVSMTAAKTVTATFAADPKYTLTTVKAGAGAGTLTSDPAGVNCPGDCSELYWKNEVVTLTAKPGANSKFSGWSGSCTGTEKTCEVTMTAAKSVTATFAVVKVAAVSLDSGPFGALMVADNGEKLLPLVDRDVSGNATKVIGAMYINTLSGQSVVVYLDDNGMPKKTIIGDYILLFSNWSGDGKTVDIAKIHATTNYIEVFKSVSINPTSLGMQGVSMAAEAAGSPASISIQSTCFPACDTDMKNFSELLKIAGLGISVGSCAVATTASLGAMALPCAGVIVSTASLVVGNETWLQNLDATGAALTANDAAECIVGNVVSCISAVMDISSRLMDACEKPAEEHSGLITTANLFLSDPNQASGVVQQGSGLPSCSASYECTPGGAMSYIPCYPAGVKQCNASCTWGACFGTCGDGYCDKAVAGENVANCPSDCPPVCGDGICSTGEKISCIQDCPTPPPTSYTLSVSKSGTGTGTVTSSPSGINCGSACSSNFSTGSSVSLMANASGGSTFTGWSGACTGTGACAVTMNSAKTVAATFTPTGTIVGELWSGTFNGTHYYLCSGSTWQYNNEEMGFLIQNGSLIWANTLYPISNSGQVTFGTSPNQVFTGTINKSAGTASGTWTQHIPGTCPHPQAGDGSGTWSAIRIQYY